MQLAKKAASRKAFQSKEGGVAGGEGGGIRQHMHSCGQIR